MKSTTLTLAALVVLASSSLAQPVQWAVESGGNGNWYEKIDQAGITWEQARTAAESMSYLGYPGHLVTLTSAEEDVWVYEVFAAPCGYWLGGYQADGSPEPDSGWMWVTTEPWLYSDWKCWDSGCEPNNTYWDGSAESCLEYDWNCQGIGWNDMPNSPSYPEHLRHGFIVEYEAMTVAEEPHTWGCVKALYR